MPSWGSGLASALTQGAVGYGEQSELNRRELLAAAARKRAEQREQEQDEIRRIEALTRAAGGGLEVTPRPDPTVPEVTPVPPIPATTREAGPAANPPKGRNVGRIGGYDVAIPEGGVQDPTVRRQSEATDQRRRNLEAYVARLPEGHPRKLTPEQIAMAAANDSAYNEYVRATINPEKPLATRVAEERALNPEKFDGRADRSGEADERSRRSWILNRSAELQRPKPNAAGAGPPTPGLSRDEALRQAEEEWNSVSSRGSSGSSEPPVSRGAPGRSIMRGGGAAAAPGARAEAGRVNTPGSKGEAPDDIVMAALQKFGGDQAKALAYLRSQGYR